MEKSKMKGAVSIMVLFIFCLRLVSCENTKLPDNEYYKAMEYWNINKCIFPDPSLYIQQHQNVRPALSICGQVLSSNDSYYLYKQVCRNLINLSRIFCNKSSQAWEFAQKQLQYTGLQNAVGTNAMFQNANTLCGPMKMFNLNQNLKEYAGVLSIESYCLSVCGPSSFLPVCQVQAFALCHITKGNECPLVSSILGTQFTNDAARTEEDESSKAKIKDGEPEDSNKVGQTQTGGNDTQIGSQETTDSDNTNPTQSSGSISNKKTEATAATSVEKTVSGTTASSTSNSTTPVSTTEDKKTETGNPNLPKIPPVDNIDPGLSVLPPLPDRKQDAEARTNGSIEPEKAGNELKSPDEQLNNDSSSNPKPVNETKGTDIPNLNTIEKDSMDKPEIEAINKGNSNKQDEFGIDPKKEINEKHDGFNQDTADKDEANEEDEYSENEDDTGSYPTTTGLENEDTGFNFRKDGESKEATDPARQKESKNEGVINTHKDIYMPLPNSDEESPGSGHFFAYFLTAVVICISGYVIFHNKQKIIAFIVEGRNGSGSSRRRSGGVKYTQLTSNVEEVMPSLENAATSKNFVY